MDVYMYIGYRESYPGAEQQAVSQLESLDQQGPGKLGVVHRWEAGEGSCI